MKECSIIVKPCPLSTQLHKPREKSKRIKARLEKLQQFQPPTVEPPNAVLDNDDSRGYVRKVMMKKLGNRVVTVVSKKSKPVEELMELEILKNDRIKKPEAEQSSMTISEHIAEPTASKFSTPVPAKDTLLVSKNTPLLVQKPSSILLAKLTPSPFNTANLNLSDTLFDGMSEISPAKNNLSQLSTNSVPPFTSTAFLDTTSPGKTQDDQGEQDQLCTLEKSDVATQTPKSIIDVLDSMEVGGKDNEKTLSGNQQHEISDNESDENFVRDLLLCDEVLESCKKTASVIEEEENSPKFSEDKLDSGQINEFLPSISYLEMLNDDIIDLNITPAIQENVTIVSSNSIGNTETSTEETSQENPEAVPTRKNDNVLLSPNAPMSANITSMFAQKKRAATVDIENPELMRVRVAESLLMLSELDTNSTFCVSCKQPVAGICQIHGNPMSLLKKTKAVLSLPLTMCVQESFLPNAGLGVFSLSVFEVGSLFGPMEGEKLTFEENSSRTNNAYVWEVYRSDRMTVAHYLDCVEEEKSNWMRFVNCARFEEEQNLIAEQYDELVFYKAYKKILPGDELLVWYGNAYGRELQAYLTPEVKLTPIEGDVQSELTSEATTSAAVKVEDKEVFGCPKCKALFSSEYYLKRHRTYVCPASSEFRCDVCSKLFKNMGNYKRHKKKGCKVQKAFKCFICGATLTQKANLKVHLKTHLNIRDFQCQHCERTFSRATFLRNHVLAVHEKGKPFICNTCGREFSRMDSMKRHKLIHNERSTICLFCGHAYQSLNALACHVARKHKNNTEMFEDKCRICHETFPDIKTHMLNVHEKRAMLECHICKHSFRNLTNHMKTHVRKESNNKETCPVCNKQFVTLNGHMKKHMTYTKLFQEGKITVEQIKKREEERKTATATVSKKRLIKTEDSLSLQITNIHSMSRKSGMDMSTPSSEFKRQMARLLSPRSNTKDNRNNNNNNNNKRRKVPPATLTPGQMIGSDIDALIERARRLSCTEVSSSPMHSATRRKSVSTSNLNSRRNSTVKK